MNKAFILILILFPAGFVSDYFHGFANKPVRDYEKKKSVKLRKERCFYAFVESLLSTIVFYNLFMGLHEDMALHIVAAKFLILAAISLWLQWLIFARLKKRYKVNFVD